MKLNERLNEIIEEKQSIIDELSEKIEQMEDDLNLRKWAHLLPSNFKESELQKTLPYPRLEMRFKRIESYSGQKDWYNVEWLYGIVYKHYTDISNDSMLFIPLGRTTSSGGGADFEKYYYDKKLELPFRDSHHILAESKVFNMPAYIICEEMNIVQEIELKDATLSGLNKMKRQSEEV